MIGELFLIFCVFVVFVFIVVVKILCNICLCVVFKLCMMLVIECLSGEMLLWCVFNDDDDDERLWYMMNDMDDVSVMEIIVI